MHESLDISSFYELPRRIFLDTGVIQNLKTYGSFIWDGEGLNPADRVFRDRAGFLKLDSLRAIMLVNERANFEFALSERSIAEVWDRGRADYLQWAYEVLDHWDTCVAEAGGLEPPDDALVRRLDSSSFGYLGEKDKSLIRDALSLSCEAFLTWENKLPKNASHIERELGIKVLTPVGYWQLLQPWARLYR